MTSRRETPGPAILEHGQPADYLTRLAASDLGRSYKSLVVGELGISAGNVVLDLGCGPGADLTAFADPAGPTGTVIGLDTDRAALDQARQRTAGSPTIAVRHADIHATGLPDGSVDIVHTDRVIQHVADPLTMLREARRVLRPAGRCVFAEPDWDTLVIDHPDLEVARAYRRFIVEQVVRNACIGRQLAGLATRADLAVSRVIPITTVFRDVGDADRVLGFRRVTERAVKAGYLTGAAGDDWLNHLATEPFFASVTLFIVVAHADPSLHGV